MRFAWILAALSALWVTPAQATTWWRLNISAHAVGSKILVDFPFPTYEPFEIDMNFRVKVPAFETTGLLYHYDQLKVDPTGLGNIEPSMSGDLSLINGELTGKNFYYFGFQGIRICSTCYAWELRAPTFAVAFVDSTDGTVPVPEPSTWLMMLVGFGAIGWAMRRSQAASFRLARI